MFETLDCCSVPATVRRGIDYVRDRVSGTHHLDGAAEFWRRYFRVEVGEPYHSRRRLGFISRFVTLPGSDTRIEIRA